MKTWTEEEVRILSENYGKIPTDIMGKMIPGKSRTAIYRKAYKMGMRVTRETEWLNRSNARKREKGSNWKGGKRKTAKGYMQVLEPDNPRADSCGYVMEHISVWEARTGMRVPSNCVVHHLNGIKDDNRIENLCLMERGAHTTFHHSGTHLSEETKNKISKARRHEEC